MGSDTTWERFGTFLLPSPADRVPLKPTRKFHSANQTMSLPGSLLSTPPFCPYLQQKTGPLGNGEGGSAYNARGSQPGASAGKTNRPSQRGTHRFLPMTRLDDMASATVSCGHCCPSPASPGLPGHPLNLPSCLFGPLPSCAYLASSPGPPLPVSRSS